MPCFILSGGQIVALCLCKTKDSFIFFKEVGYSGIYGDITG
nr:MAG TPA: hypothetical protein [Caudoviricetes sp.]